MDREIVHIYDTSLRDGLRNSGVAISLDDKVRFVAQLECLKVGAIEVGFGGPSQVETMARLAEAAGTATAFGLSRVNVKDMDRVLGAVGRAERSGINIFSPVSAGFLEHSGGTPAQALEASVRAIRHARGHVDEVLFSAQDAARADRGFLVDLLGAVVEAGADAISLPDTTSQALPHEFGALCGGLRREVPGGTGVRWSVHCHNDLGLAVANCLAAIDNGVRQVECTVNGIGERAGNTALQLVARVLDKRADAYPAVRTDLAMDRLDATSTLLAEIGQPTDEADSDVVDLLRRWRAPAAGTSA